MALRPRPIALCLPPNLFVALLQWRSRGWCKRPKNRSQPPQPHYNSGVVIWCVMWTGMGPCALVPPPKCQIIRLEIEPVTYMIKNQCSDVTIRSEVGLLEVYGSNPTEALRLDIKKLANHGAPCGALSLGHVVPHNWSTSQLIKQWKYTTYTCMMMPHVKTRLVHHQPTLHSELMMSAI